MEPVDVAIDAAEGRRIELAFAGPQGSAEPAAGLVLIGAPAAWIERCAAAGFALASVPNDTSESSDRSRLADLTRVLRWLADRADVDDQRIGVVGFGSGGTQAFLLGCHADGIAAVVDCGGPLVYPELDSRRPMQPLEMALNLSAPLLAFFGAEDASIPAGHVDDLRRTLDQFAKPCDVIQVPGATRDFFDDTCSGYDDNCARSALERTLSFLCSELDLESR